MFGRLWERLGLGEVLNELVTSRGFEFALERAVFVSVLHRLFVSGSDRSCEKWMGDYAICVVADRGMISAATIAALEERGLDYILEARERGTAAIREIVLKNEKPFVPLLFERRAQRHPALRQAGDGPWPRATSYAATRRRSRRAGPTAIRSSPTWRSGSRGGDRALIGNAGYRRYLRRTGAGKAFEIDAGKLAEEARFDGIFVLRTNATMTPLNAVLRYRELLLVEDLFRRAKVQLRTRPIYHSCDAAIRGHVFCLQIPGGLDRESYGI